MLRKCFVFALVVVGIVSSMSIPRTADMDMLVKQKKVLDILMYASGNVLTDAEYFETGRNYDIMSNIDRYTNREVVVNFLMRYRLGLLNRDSLFSYYNEQDREEMKLLYRLFFTAKDFSTFYRTACWARLNVNSALFATAFTNAVIYRDDTKGIRLPAIYELFPSMFFDSRMIREAQRIAMTRGMGETGRQLGMLRKGDMMDSIETFYLNSNNTDICLNTMDNGESKLNYFYGDVGLNAFYYNARMMMPFWMNSKDYNLPNNIRGELYYFIHQQLMARNYLERISNGLGEIEVFSWNRMSLPGFYSNIVYPNGVAVPGRDWWNKVPLNKQRYMEYLKKLETRIWEAIDSGYAVDEMGKNINVMSNDGFNILGNLIEGNYDSINLKYYGSYDVLARRVLGMNVDTVNRNENVPSALQLWSTSMRDPAFYRMYNKIIQAFLRYKTLLRRYTKNELEFTGVRIENVEVDKLVTFFDNKEYLINNAVDVPTMKDGLSFNIKTRQYQLNSKPFTYKLSINSDKMTKGVVRIFLGPAIEGEKYDDYTYLNQYYKYFFMLDEFSVNLREGMNNIDRLSTDSTIFKKEYLTGDKFYKKINQAIQGKQPLTYSSRMYGFPDNLLLPKGSVDGMRFKLFFYIGPYEDAKMVDLPILGQRMWYGKPLGFPLDRPILPWMLTLDNICLKDVLIYNMVDYERMGERRQSSMRNYQEIMQMNDHSMKMQIKDLKDTQSTRDNEDSMRMRDYGRMSDINMMHI